MAKHEKEVVVPATTRKETWYTCDRCGKVISNHHSFDHTCRICQADACESCSVRRYDLATYHSWGDDTPTYCKRCNYENPSDEEIEEKRQEEAARASQEYLNDLERRVIAAEARIKELEANKKEKES